MHMGKDAEGNDVFKHYRLRMSLNQEGTHVFAFRTQKWYPLVYTMNGDKMESFLDFEQYLMDLERVES